MKSFYFIIIFLICFTSVRAEIKTGQEGKTFQTKIPVIARGNVGLLLKITCDECRAQKQKLRYYPIGTRFKIESFSYTKDQILVQTKDTIGNVVIFSEEKFKEMVDGGPGNLQNEELILLDVLKEGTKYVEHSVSINKSSLGFKKNYKEVLRKILMEEGNLPKVLELTRAQRIENEIVTRIRMDVETYVTLFHLRYIRPYYKIHHYEDFIQKYRSRWENKNIYPLGKPVELIISEAKLKSF